MKKRGIFIIAGIALLMGCVAARTYTVEKPRIDTEIEGNRGYLSGSPVEGEVKKSRLGDTRKISVLEIELADKNKPADRTAADESLSIQDEGSYDSAYDYEDEDVYVEEITVKESTQDFEYYVVQKNDTLQKISQKFYGTTSKWKYLFDFNKGTIKNPDKVFPGMKIKIPTL